MEQIFSSVSETDITRATVDGFMKDLQDHVESDVLVVGGGPSGLMAARDLANNGFKVVLIERNNYLGGGLWMGGYLMNKVTVRDPAQEVFRELEIPFKQTVEGLYITDGAHAAAKLIAHACDAGVKVFNMTVFEDVLIRRKSVAGGVINWWSGQAPQHRSRTGESIALGSKVVLDATGYEAFALGKMAERGFLKRRGYSTMWEEASEDRVVQHTGEVYEGLFIAGMAVITLYGLPKLGPTFGAMLLSGRRAGELIKDKLKGL